MAGKTLSLRVVSPVEVVFEGEVSSLTLPSWDGQIGILPGHAPYIGLLGGGVMEAQLPGGATESYFLFRGVAKVEEDRVTVLTEYAGDGPPEGYDPGQAWLDPVDLEAMADPGNPLV